MHLDTVLVHYASGYQIQVLALVKAATFIGILVGVGIVYSLCTRLHKMTGPHFDLSSDLPLLRMRAPGRRFRAWQC